MFLTCKALVTCTGCNTLAVHFCFPQTLKTILKLTLLARQFCYVCFCNQTWLLCSVIRTTASPCLHIRQNTCNLVGFAFTSLGLTWLGAASWDPSQVQSWPHFGCQYLNEKALLINIYLRLWWIFECSQTHNTKMELAAFHPSHGRVSASQPPLPWMRLRSICAALAMAHHSPLGPCPLWKHTHSQHCSRWLLSVHHHCSFVHSIYPNGWI